MTILGDQTRIQSLKDEPPAVLSVNGISSNVDADIPSSGEKEGEPMQIGGLAPPVLSPLRFY
jgi:hypothetical protein